MSRVRQSGTEPELKLRRALLDLGLRYRLNSTPRLPGRPDLFFLGARIAVFVDGCFWHGCPIHGTSSKTNSEFWRLKIERNKERDSQVDAQLIALGWHPVRFWEHEVKTDADACALRLRLLKEGQ